MTEPISDTEFKKLKRLISRQKPRVEKMRKEHDELHKRLSVEENKLNQLEARARHESHKYDKGDKVLVKTGEDSYSVHQIQQTYGRKGYRTFEYLGVHTGTEEKINESQIVCLVQSIPNFFELKRKAK